MDEIQRTLEKIVLALGYVPADDYEEHWIAVAMALHDFEVKSNEDMFLYFHEWSKSCPEKYLSEEDCRKKWESFSSNRHEGEKRTIGTLFHLAIEHGMPNSELASRIEVTNSSSIQKYLPQVRQEDHILQKKIIESEESLEKLPFHISPRYILPSNFFTSCPSPLGELTQAICDIARKPLPGSTLLSLAAFIGHLKSKIVTVPDEGLWPTIYCVGLAATSSGKDLPQQIINQLSETLEIRSIYSDIRTEKSTWRLLENYNSIYFFIDEVTEMLKSVSRPNAESYVQGIPGLLIKTWSLTNKTYRLPATVDKKDKDIILNKPKLSFMGFAQHSCMECFATAEFIERGFAPRFIYSIEQLYQEPRDINYCVNMPEEVIEYFKKLYQECTNYLLQQTCSSVEFKAVKIEKEAQNTFDELAKELNFKIKQALLNGDEITSHIMGKAVENAKRLALAICEIGADIDKDLAIWCCKLMRHQVSMISELYFKVEDAAATKNSDNIIQRIINKHIEIFKDKNEVRLSELRRLCRYEDHRGRGFKHYFNQACEIGIFKVKLQGEGNHAKKLVFLTRKNI